jgi:hypothetical protein
LFIILPLILYGCEAWPFTLSEEHRLKVFESSVLRRIVGLKMEDVAGGSRRLRDEELHKLYASSNNIRVIE